MTILRISIVGAIVMMIACSNHATTPDSPAAADAPLADSANPPDVSQADAPPVDALALTPCGDKLKCDAMKEICVVRTPVGPGETFTCEPIPAGCEADHTCSCAGSTLCVDAYNACHDSSELNTITCECNVCQ